MIGGRQQPTEFIARGNNPTTVMSAAPAVTATARCPPRTKLSTPVTTTTDRTPRSRPANGRSASTTVTRKRHASAPLPRRCGACAKETPAPRPALDSGAGGRGIVGRRGRLVLRDGTGLPGTVPQLTNKTVAEAQQLLRAAGFQSTTKDVYDDDVSPGLVVGSEPAAGEVIRKFLPVSLAVSKGPQLFPCRS
ncbi:PASTA domain-containing protein [Arthrobacter sp. OVS8]|nr:PASTA domain-containing protein [Arthrobacter sp. OVS8]